MLQCTFEFRSNLDSRVFLIDGMSGKAFRCFLHNLCELPSTCYWEVGTWKGLILCSAMNEFNVFVGIVILAIQCSNVGNNSHFLDAIVFKLTWIHYKHIHVHSFIFRMCWMMYLCLLQMIGIGVWQEKKHWTVLNLSM